MFRSAGLSMISCLPRRSWRSIGSFDPLLGALRPQQASSTQVEIRKCEVYGQPMRVFRKSTIANFCKTKDALENVEDMLDARTHARFRTIRFALLNGKILRTRRMRLREVRRVVRQHSAIMHVCRRRNKRMNEPALAINADVRLHPKVPFISLFGLMHLGIAFTAAVLGH